MLQQLHLINNSNSTNSNVAFDYSSNTIIEINDFVFDILQQLQNNTKVHEISKQKGIEEEKLNSFIEKFSSSIPEPIDKEKPISKNRIGRITLHVSNDCNLSCTYCYASGGNYEQEKKLMSKKTALDFINFFTSRFDEIGSIVFFWWRTSFEFRNY